MLDTIRTDRIFESFLDVQEMRIDDPSEGLSAADRNNLLEKIRKSGSKARRVRRIVADQSYEKFLDAKDEGFGGTFFDWLIENKDMILGIIKMIMMMFGL